ncbi:hypothetical protein BT67DRAFT_443366 [Trichocladium antarcticum]|uniref:Uncharacterized protein n=1 Tax=Trichocladium antarcticum TaxID=1450529 RepID=A0AAN6UJT5_9PEZI|nr:hypothetical protein BT67DRAFT_443366 [Trichocladium antarcticum]
MDTNPSQGYGAPASQSSNDAPTIFQKFDSYPWARDRSFLQGLMATLGPSLASPNDGFVRQKALSTTLQARIWWYKSRFNSDIDRSAYEAYSASHASSCPDGAILATLEEIQQRMGAGNASASSSAGPPVPAWQLNAPKVDLSKKAEDATGHANSDGGAPYPENFQALIEAVTMGKPIPGIREIPDTVVRPPGVTPFGKMKAPRKPWEKDLPADAAAQASIFGDVVDKEFPPLP